MNGKPKPFDHHQPPPMNEWTNEIYLSESVPERYTYSILLLYCMHSFYKDL